MRGRKQVTLLDTLTERVLRHGTTDPDNCWLWEGYINPAGYGHVGVSDRVWYVHRLAYTIVYGEIPPLYEVDHLCHNEAYDLGLCDGRPDCVHTACFNPAHLEAITKEEHMLRAGGVSRNAAKTQCSKGHPYDEENTFIRSNGGRECRACNNDRYHARQGE